MAQGSRSWKNVPLSTVSPSKSEQLASPEKKTPVPSDMGPPDAPAPDAPVPAPGLALTSTDELFKQFIKAHLKAQTLAPIEAEPREQPLKACFQNLYYGNSHMNCYHFCQHCEDHFETAEATEYNRIPFAALFLCGTVVQQWQQHKRRFQRLVPMTWIEFKSFLWKNLGDSRTFINNL